MLTANEKVEIKKFKLNGTGIEIEYNYITIDPKTKEPTCVSYVRKNGPMVHDDLIKRVSRLSLHLVYLCELYSEKLLKGMRYELPQLSLFTVTGATFSGTGDNAGLVISGTKNLKRGMKMNLVSPFQYLLDSTEEPYYLCNELVSDVAGVQLEILEYLFNNKTGQLEQLTLGFEQAN